PHEGRVLAGRCLARIEQRRTRAPHHGRRDRAGFMVTDNVEELIDMIEPHDDHESSRKLWPLSTRRISWRLTQIDMQSKQRRERSGAAARHLCLSGAREQGRDMMAEAFHAQVDLAQTVEEQKSRLHGRMLELPMHEFER